MKDRSDTLESLNSSSNGLPAEPSVVGYDFFSSPEWISPRTESIGSEGESHTEMTEYQATVSAAESRQGGKRNPNPEGGFIGNAGPKWDLMTLRSLNCFLRTVACTWQDPWPTRQDKATV